eukprot:757876-Hanusia_phi.AAC.4
MAEDSAEASISSLEDREVRAPALIASGFVLLHLPDTVSGMGTLRREEGGSKGRGSEGARYGRGRWEGKDGWMDGWMGKGEARGGEGRRGGREEEEGGKKRKKGGNWSTIGIISLVVESSQQQGELTVYPAPQTR